MAKTLREALNRAVTDDVWVADIKSDEGKLLRQLKDLGFIRISIDQGYYSVTSVTDLGLAQNRAWSTSRRRSA